VFKQILFPVDLGEPDSWRDALPVALEQCRWGGAILHVLTVLPEFSARFSQYFPDHAREKYRADSIAELAKFVKDNIPAGIEVREVISEGTVYQEIMAAAGEVGADLIVMASHAPSTMKHLLLGANADQVVRHCDCSVLVVRTKT
jgi:nucleotide-binding universal stress UspA family protein